MSSLPSLVWYLLQSSRVPPIFSVVPASQGNMTLVWSHQWSRNYLALQSFLPSLVWHLLLNLQLQSSRVPSLFSVAPTSVADFPPLFSVVPVTQSLVTELQISLLSLVWYLLLNLQLQSPRFPSSLQCGTCYSISSYRAPDFPPLFSVVPVTQSLVTEPQISLLSLVWYLLLNLQLQSPRFPSSLQCGTCYSISSYRAPDFPPLFSVVPVTQSLVTEPQISLLSLVWYLLLNLQLQSSRFPSSLQCGTCYSISSYRAIQISLLSLVWYLLLNLQLQSPRFPSSLQCGTCYSISSYRAPDFPPLFSVVPVTQSLVTEPQISLLSLVWYLLLNLQLQSPRFPSSLQCGTCYSISSYRAPDFPPLFSVVPVTQSLVTEPQISLLSLVWYLLLNLQLQSPRFPSSLQCGTCYSISSYRAPDFPPLFSVVPVTQSLVTEPQISLLSLVWYLLLNLQLQSSRFPSSLQCGTCYSISSYRAPDFPPLFSVVPVTQSLVTEPQISLLSLVWYLLLNLQLQSPRFPSSLWQCGTCYSISSYRAPDFPPLFSVVPVTQSLVTELQISLLSLVWYLLLNLQLQSPRFPSSLQCGTCYSISSYRAPDFPPLFSVVPVTQSLVTEPQISLLSLVWYLLLNLQLQSSRFPSSLQCGTCYSISSYRAPDFPPLFSVVPVTQSLVTELQISLLSLVWYLLLNLQLQSSRFPSSLQCGTCYSISSYRAPDFPPLFSVVPVTQSLVTEPQISLLSLVWYLLLNLQLQSSRFPSSLQCGTCYSISSYRAPDFPPLFSVVPVTQSLVTELQISLLSLVWYLLLNLQLQSSRFPSSLQCGTCYSISSYRAPDFPPLFSVVPVTQSLVISLLSLVWYLLLNLSRFPSSLQCGTCYSISSYRAPDFPPLFSVVPVTQSLVTEPQISLLSLVWYLLLNLQLQSPRFPSSLQCGTCYSISSYRAPDFPPLFSVVPVTQSLVTELQISLLSLVWYLLLNLQLQSSRFPSSLQCGTCYSISSYRAPDFPPLFSVVPVTQSLVTELQISLLSLVWYLLLNLQLQSPRFPSSLQCGTCYSISSYRAPDFPPLFSVVPVTQSLVTELQISLLSLVWYLLLNLQLQSSRFPSSLQCGTCYSISSYRAPDFPPLFSVVPVTQSLVTELQISLLSLVWYLLSELQSSLPSLVWHLFLNLQFSVQYFVNHCLSF